MTVPKSFHMAKGKDFLAIRASELRDRSDESVLARIRRHCRIASFPSRGKVLSPGQANPEQVRERLLKAAERVDDSYSVIFDPFSLSFLGMARNEEIEDQTEESLFPDRRIVIETDKQVNSVRIDDAGAVRVEGKVLSATDYQASLRAGIRVSRLLGCPAGESLTMQMCAALACDSPAETGMAHQHAIAQTVRALWKCNEVQATIETKDEIDLETANHLCWLATNPSNAWLLSADLDTLLDHAYRFANGICRSTGTKTVKRRTGLPLSAWHMLDGHEHERSMRRSLVEVTGDEGLLKNEFVLMSALNPGFDGIDTWISKGDMALTHVDRHGGRDTLFQIGDDAFAALARGGQTILMTWPARRFSSSTSHYRH